ncbi:hypothetical protein [Amycolatopsis sp. NPDC004625]|uniref:hypothetical protein n=1 Tax=Amycolatopsis sp. NPDC004625 TaxID=3154670 RepID=UPI0033A18691
MEDPDFPDLAPEERAEVATGPWRFARDWVGAVLADDVDRAWTMMSEELRLALAQMWIFHNPGVLSDSCARGLDRDGLTERLLRADPADGLFINMRSVEIRTIREAMGVASLDQLGTGSRPRPIGVDLELVRLFVMADLDVDDRGKPFFAAGASATCVSVIVSGADGGRRVAGFFDSLFRPGWPPAQERIVNPED